MTHAWFGDWYERVKQRAHERGFASATAFVETQPTVSLRVLADELGKDDVAASQLEKLLVDEAEESGTIERCARGLLVRRLHHKLPEGWRTDWDRESTIRRASAIGAWYSALPRHYDPCLERVEDALMAAHIPEGWLPDGPDDPILLAVFQHWSGPKP